VLAALAVIEEGSVGSVTTWHIRKFADPIERQARNLEALGIQSAREVAGRLHLLARHLRSVKLGGV